MSKDSIRLSEQHGANPSVMICPCCGKDTGVALCGHLKGDAEAPRQMRDSHPCEKCQADFDDYMTKGLVLFIVKDESEDRQHDKGFSPWYYYVGVSVLRRESELAKDIIKQYSEEPKACLLPESVAKQLGVHPEQNKETEKDKANEQEN